MTERNYYDHTRVYSPHGFSGCEHCDAEKSNLVRVDYDRGQVCPVCDDALDEMYPLCTRCADLGESVPATNDELCAACHDSAGEGQDARAAEDV